LYYVNIRQDIRDPDFRWRSSLERCHGAFPAGRIKKYHHLQRKYLGNSLGQNAEPVRKQGYMRDMDIRHHRDGSSLHDLAFLDDSAGFACGDIGYIVKTGDGGKTWIKKSDSLVGIISYMGPL
jgi:hypothetical protein